LSEEGEDEPEDVDDIEEELESSEDVILRGDLVLATTHQHLHIDGEIGHEHEARETRVDSVQPVHHECHGGDHGDDAEDEDEEGDQRHHSHATSEIVFGLHGEDDDDATAESRHHQSHQHRLLRVLHRETHRHEASGDREYAGEDEVHGEGATDALAADEHQVGHEEGAIGGEEPSSASALQIVLDIGIKEGNRRHRCHHSQHESDETEDLAYECHANRLLVELQRVLEGSIFSSESRLTASLGLVGRRHPTARHGRRDESGRGRLSLVALLLSAVSLLSPIAGIES
ncbi:hypothetical protein PENTCL1PPCAC_1635, partial [Pristionchus entomophagus]